MHLEIEENIKTFCCQTSLASTSISLRSVHSKARLHATINYTAGFLKTFPTYLCLNIQKVTETARVYYCSLYLIAFMLFLILIWIWMSLIIAVWGLNCGRIKGWYNHCDETIIYHWTLIAILLSSKTCLDLDLSKTVVWNKFSNLNSNGLNLAKQRIN